MAFFRRQVLHFVMAQSASLPSFGLDCFYSDQAPNFLFLEALLSEMLSDEDLAKLDPLSELANSSTSTFTLSSSLK